MTVTTPAKGATAPSAVIPVSVDARFLPIVLETLPGKPTISSRVPPETGLYIQGTLSTAPALLTAVEKAATYGPVTYTVGPDTKLTFDYVGANKVRTAMAGSLYPPWAPVSVSVPSSEPVLSTSTAGGIPASLSSLLSTSMSPRNTTSTSESEPESQSGNAGTGVSPGAIAGIAIGCLVAGALIAGLAVWFFLGKARRLRPSRADERSPLTTMHTPEKSAVAQTVSLGSGSPISTSIDHGLPQPLEDKAISSGMSSLANSIKNHVQSFYHSGRAGLLDVEDLQDLGKDLPVSRGKLSTLLGNPETREVALRFCIAWVIVSRMQLPSPPADTLLPQEIATCYRDMLSNNQRNPSHAVFLSKWRAITAELTQTRYVRDGFFASDSRLPNIEKAVKTLDGIVRPYADSRMDNSRRVQNLREVVKRASSFAFTLFSQQSTFEYDWQEQQGVRSGSLCVFPALVQVTDEAGNALKPPRAFSEATSRPLGI